MLRIETVQTAYVELTQQEVDSLMGICQNIRYFIENCNEVNPTEDNQVKIEKYSESLFTQLREITEGYESLEAINYFSGTERPNAKIMIPGKIFFNEFCWLLDIAEVVEREVPEGERVLTKFSKNISEEIQKHEKQ